eukprot:2477986-Rhodomonas_salina.2
MDLRANVDGNHNGSRAFIVSRNCTCIDALSGPGRSTTYVSHTHRISTNTSADQLPANPLCDAVDVAGQALRVSSLPLLLSFPPALPPAVLIINPLCSLPPFFSSPHVSSSTLACKSSSSTLACKSAFPHLRCPLQVAVHRRTVVRLGLE